MEVRELVGDSKGVPASEKVKNHCFSMTRPGVKPQFSGYLADAFTDTPSAGLREVTKYLIHLFKIFTCILKKHSVGGREPSVLSLDPPISLLM